jgi:aquaporin NIP
MTDIRKLAAEFIGTFAMILVGCGAISVEASQPGVIGHGGVSLIFGLVVGAMIYATGHISGAHFNPAVTLGFASTGRFPWAQVPLYTLAQVLAAISAMAVLSWVLPDHASGVTGTSLTLGKAFAVEGMITFFLMFVIASVATDHRAVSQLAGVAIGATVTLGALFGGPLTGASMNPARSVGPALVLGDMTNLWLYLVAPCVGAVAGAWAYRLIRCDDQEAEDVDGCC